MRKRLIEILEDTLNEWECDVSIKTLTDIADHLIENGVIILPCKIGDTVYKCHTVNFKHTGEITKRTIKQITFSAFTVTDDGESGWFDIDNLGKTVFLTREEAEKALKERDDDG